MTAESAGRAVRAALVALVLLGGFQAAADERHEITADHSRELEHLAMELLTESRQYNSSRRISFRPLTSRERERAGQLRRRLGSMMSEQISDLELLGIHAHSAAEREDYAEQFALRYRALTRAALRFDSAVVRAHRRLFGGGPLFDAEQWKPPGYRWNLKIGGVSDSKEVLQRVLRSARAGQASRIRLAGSGKQRAIAWIRRSLPPSLVRQGMFHLSWTEDATGFAEGLKPLPVQAPIQTPARAPNLPQAVEK